MAAHMKEEARRTISTHYVRVVDVLRNILLLKYLVVFLATTEEVFSHYMQKSKSLSTSRAVQCGGSDCT